MEEKILKYWREKENIPRKAMFSESLGSEKVVSPHFITVQRRKNKAKLVPCFVKI